MLKHWSLVFAKKRSLRDYVRKWVVWSLFFNSDSIYKRSFDTSWIFSACVWEEGNFVLQRERDSPLYIQTKPDAKRPQKESLVWKHIGLSLSTSGFLLASKKKLWFRNSLQCIGQSLSLFWSGNSKHFLAQALCSDQHLLRIPTPSATENQPKKVLKFPSIYL